MTPELYQCPYEAACKCSMEDPCKGCETWAKAFTGKKDDKLSGRFVKAWECASCEKELTWHEKMYSHGTCQYCGATEEGTIIKTNEFSKRLPA